MIVGLPVYGFFRLEWQDLVGGYGAPWWLYLIPPVYLFLPAMAVRVFGYLTMRSSIAAWKIGERTLEQRTQRFLLRRKIMEVPATEWVRLFRHMQGKAGLVFCKMKETHEWVAGLLGENGHGLSSSASFYPEPEQLLLSQQIEVDANGNPVLTSEGHLKIIPGSLVLSHDDIICMECYYL